MFGTLLDKLQSIFSKSLVIGSIPLLAFLVLHGLVIYHISDAFRARVQWYFGLGTGKTAELTMVLLLGVAVISYVLSTLSVFLREVIEGKHLHFAWLEDALSQRYRERLAVVEENLAAARRFRRNLRSFQEASTNLMGKAYRTGQTTKVCTYQRRPQLTALTDSRAANQDITLAQLEGEVNAIATILGTNSPELETDPSKNLDADYVALLGLIGYALDKADAEYVRYLTESQFDYAGHDVAPTKMGNISKIAPYYASSRYSMNIDIFWTRLQKVAQADTNFYASLQDAKMQLDFLVSLIWHTLVFTLVWAILLPLLTEAKYLYAIIVVSGPPSLWIWYLIALQNYRAFSDLLRSSVDLYRLDLLKTLRIPLPANAEQERLVWEMLERRVVYDDHSNFLLQSS
jgi:hypothetical protein